MEQSVEQVYLMKRPLHGAENLSVVDVLEMRGRTPLGLATEYIQYVPVCAHYDTS